MDFITYPLQLAKDFHKQLKEAAFKADKSIKDYILEAIKEKIQRSE